MPYRILAVDDEQFDARSTLDYLESHGLSVTRCETIEEAIQLWDRDAYDIVLLDLMMGDGRTGLELYDHIRGSRADSRTPIMIYTNYVTSPELIPIADSDPMLRVLNKARTLPTQMPHEITELIRQSKSM